MEKLTKTQLPLLVSYSMPFVLIFAIIMNGFLAPLHFSENSLRLAFLGASFPVGFLIGRVIYLRRSHVEIFVDPSTFRVVKGKKEIAGGSWRSYRMVSLVLDQFGKPDLRLYKSVGGDHIDLPISKTNAEPQRVRDFVQSIISGRRTEGITPRVAEAA